MIVALTGGIGNQMFQYAFGRALQEKKQNTLDLDTIWYRTDKLRGFALENYGIKYHALVEEETFQRRRLKVQRIPLVAYAFRLHKEVREFCIDPLALHCNYEFYCGYWQNYRYFAHMRELLCRELTYRGELRLEEQLFLDKIKSEDSVGIHIRRGDYLKGPDLEIYSQVPIAYYVQALQKVLACDSKRGQKQIYCFSDDIPWCREAFAEPEKKLGEQFGVNIVYVDSSMSSSQHTDLLFMRNCKTLITANSTFSWWAAWLNEREDKRILVPFFWMQNPKQNERLLKALIPPQWEILKVD